MHLVTLIFQCKFFGYMFSVLNQSQWQIVPKLTETHYTTQSESQEERHHGLSQL